MACLKLAYKPYDLQLKYPFTVASYSRTTSPVVLVTLTFDGVTGYGEAATPPYLGESQQSVIDFYKKLNITQFTDPFQVEEILSYVDSVAEKNTAAKAGIDIALHDLVGKLLGQPLYKIWGYNAGETPYTSFTIGIDKPEIVKQKTLEATDFKRLKIKVGLENDKEIIETIRKITNVSLCVDANQGWKDKHQALGQIEWMADKGVVFVEQPMPKEQKDDIAWLTAHSPLPIIADEGVQRLADVPNIKGLYSGINVKLMKSTGLREAHQMLQIAKALRLQTMMGCMTETSCGVSAAAQLSTLVDWADLDGNLLITNDIFDGVKVIGGKIKLPNGSGIGVEKK